MLWCHCQTYPSHFVAFFVFHFTSTRHSFIHVSLTFVPFFPYVWKLPKHSIVSDVRIHWRPFFTLRFMNFNLRDFISNPSFGVWWLYLHFCCCRCLQNFFPGLIAVVYVLRPSGLLQKAISEVSNKFFREDFRFKVRALPHSNCRLYTSAAFCLGRWYLRRNHYYYTTRFSRLWCHHVLFVPNSFCVLGGRLQLFGWAAPADRF